MVNVNLLKNVMQESNVTMEDLSKAMEIDRSTLFRRFNDNGLSFTIKEAQVIIKLLKLTPSQVDSIFFGK